jgi:alpha-N-arabinofuranosidase
MEYHVSVTGADTNDGSAGAPLETISAAAQQAQPGDVITVHEGTYRERIDPPRGGNSEDERIVYRAPEDETVVVKGSEVVTGWSKSDDGYWKLTLSNSFFGDLNPFDDIIRGDWFADHGQEYHRGDVYVDGASLRETESLQDLVAADEGQRVWYADVDESVTTIMARFGGIDPREATVEVNVRPVVFYPSEPGRDYITVRGFTMRHAATQWAPPTTEQIGLLGTHWSKGWTIEDNVVSHSRCTGITLGKYGAGVDDTGASADRYNTTIREALENGWERGSVGEHVVHNNTVFRCEQAGIVGSMGGAFSEISSNYIYDINVEGQLDGAEIAGLKLHGPIDTEIRNNRIHHARRGMWMDWMTQGTRITGNLLYDNDIDDLFFEVNHGPFVVDNNISLSEVAVTNASQGGAYVHNLFGGEFNQVQVLDRTTPYHDPHSTEIRGMSNITGGDDRVYNNVFTRKNDIAYEDVEYPVHSGGNVYLKTASEEADDPFDTSDPDPPIELREEDGQVAVILSERMIDDQPRSLVTTDLLGTATVPDLPYENPDGTSLVIETDYFGDDRHSKNPVAGPFARDRVVQDDLSLPFELDVWPA